MLAASLSYRVAIRRHFLCKSLPVKRRRGAVELSESVAGYYSATQQHPAAASLANFLTAAYSGKYVQETLPPISDIMGLDAAKKGAMPLNAL